MDVILIDPFEVCRRNEVRQGHVVVANTERLAAASADRSGVLDWQLKGGKGLRGYPQLTLSVKGKIQLMCQRCLNPFAFEIDSESSLILAKDDAGADEIEEMLDDDAVEVIAVSDATDVIALVEDEVLLVLPLSPRHEVCPDSALAERKGKKESPFAVLRELKK